MWRNSLTNIFYKKKECQRTQLDTEIELRTPPNLKTDAYTRTPSSHPAATNRPRTNTEYNGEKGEEMEITSGYDEASPLTWRVGGRSAGGRSGRAMITMERAEPGDRQRAEVVSWWRRMHSQSRGEVRSLQDDIIDGRFISNGNKFKAGGDSTGNQIRRGTMTRGDWKLRETFLKTGFRWINRASSTGTKNQRKN